MRKLLNAVTRKRGPMHLGVPTNLNGTFSKLCSPDWAPMGVSEQWTGIDAQVNCARCLALMDKYDDYFKQSLASETAACIRPDQA
jgi:hypothetical protein